MSGRRSEGMEVRLGSEYAVIRALVRPVLRTLPWRMLGAAGVLGLLFAGLPRLMPGESLGLLRAAALVLALGLAFLLDDPARHTTAAVPARRSLRIGLRVALVAPLAALWWTAALLLVPKQIRPPVGAVTLELAAVAVLALAAASASVRYSGEAEPGVAIAAGLLPIALAAPLLLPDRWALVVAEGDPRWAAAHERWGVVLAVGTLVWATCAPEPLKRRRVRLFSRFGV